MDVEGLKGLEIRGRIVGSVLQGYTGNILSVRHCIPQHKLWTLPYL